MLIRNDCASLSKKNVTIGEKSNIIPGPPRGDLSINRRTGASIGSVNANINPTILPFLAMGIQVKITRINNITNRILNSQPTASAMIGIIAPYLRLVFGMI